MKSRHGASMAQTRPPQKNIIQLTFSSKNFAYVTIENDAGTSRIREVW